MPKTKRKIGREIAAVDQIDNVAKFRRAIHSKGDLHQGVNSSRKYLRPDAVSGIIHHLASNPVYLRAIAPDPFPRSFGRIKPRRSHAPCIPQIEAAWISTILSIYTAEISQYVSLRDNFYDALCEANYEEAHHILDDLEARFGVSLWLISSRISLLQLREGTAAQKEFLESVMSSDSVNFFVAYIAFFFSYGAEENVSISELSREIADLDKIGAPEGLIEYFKYHANLLDLTYIGDPWGCITLEESSPLIDRFETFIDMCQLLVVRAEDDADNEFLVSALRQISSIPDARISNMLFVLGSEEALPQVDRALDVILDLYTAGRYDEAKAAADELVSRKPSSAAYWDIATFCANRVGSRFAAPPESSVAGRMLADLQSIEACTEGAQRARASIQKLALLTRRQPASRFIASYLDRHIDLPIARTITENQAIWTLSSPFNNPAHLRIIHKLSETAFNRYVSSGDFDVTTTSALHLATLGVNIEFEALAGTIPYSRQQLFLAYTLFNQGDYRASYDAFQRSLSSTEPEFRYKRSNAIYMNLQHLGDLTSALKLFCADYLQREATAALYPLEEFCDWCCKHTAADENSLGRAIVLSAHGKLFGNRYEGHLSDAFEDVLDFYGVERPTEMLSLLKSEDHRGMILYYLRHVCSIRRMEDSIIFANYDEVENERIKILQDLTEADPNNRNAYAEEIRQISREAEIARLTAEFERSKIYVNEKGIAEVLASELPEMLSRYRLLLNEPSLEMRVEGIERSLKRLSRDTESELKNIKLPSTERGAIFESFYHLTLDHFVLNPSHGLKTYLSTRILHGALEGELLASFTRHELIINTNDAEEMFGLWKDRLGANEAICHSVAVNLSRFSKRINELIAEQKDKYVRIESDEFPDGLIKFHSTEEELDSLRSALSSAVTYDDSLAVLFGHFWDLIERSLANIKHELEANFRRKVDVAFDGLVVASNQSAEGMDISSLLDAIAHCRTEFAVDLDRVKAWFARAGSPPTEPFTIETAVGVATVITNNCWPKKAIGPEIHSPSDLKLQGSVLMPLIEIFSNCLQNANQHSGLDDRAPSTSVTVDIVGNDVAIIIRNELGSEIDIDDRRRKIERHLLACGSPGNPEAVAVEGGSGFRKIQRSLEHEAFGRDLAATILDGSMKMSFILEKEKVAYEDPSR